MELQNAEIIAMLHYQIGALEGMALSQGLTLSHMKPHGALYHDMMTSRRVREAVFEAVASYHRALPLIMQATARANEHREEAQSVGITLWFEAFADRRYADDGSLLPRDKPGAVLDQEATRGPDHAIMSGGHRHHGQWRRADNRRRYPVSPRRQPGRGERYRRPARIDSRAGERTVKLQVAGENSLILYLGRGRR